VVAGLQPVIHARQFHSNELVKPGDWVCVGGLSGLGVYCPSVFKKDFQVVGSVCGTSTSASDCVLAVDTLEASEETDHSRTEAKSLSEGLADLCKASGREE